MRDPRGFAVKFYTEDGNWDLVGNNTPIFFIRDPLHVSDGCVLMTCVLCNISMHMCIIVCVRVRVCVCVRACVTE